MVLPCTLPWSVFTVSGSANMVLETPSASPANKRAHNAFNAICIPEFLRGIPYQDGPEDALVSKMRIGGFGSLSIFRPSRRLYGRWPLRGARVVALRAGS